MYIVNVSGQRRRDIDAELDVKVGKKEHAFIEKVSGHTL
jgi:hypothetical protein